MERKVCYKNRALRMALGLTQEEVAALIDVSIATVSLYERDMIDGSYYDNIISQELLSIKDRMVNRIGYWYDAYIDNKAALHEIEIYLDFDKTVPKEVIAYAKVCAVRFSEV